MSCSHCIKNNDSKLFCLIVDLNRVFNHFSFENDLSHITCVRGRVSKYLYALYNSVYCREYKASIQYKSDTDLVFKIEWRLKEILRVLS